MKTVNSYDNDGYFNGVIPCQESPLEKGVYLIPAKSTELELPVVSELEEARFVDGAWTVVMSRKEAFRLYEESLKEPEEEKELTVLISEKIKEIAVAALKADGVLDQSGAIAAKPILEEPIA